MSVVLQKAEAAPKLTTAESIVPLPTSSSHCKRKRQSKQQHDIQLPAVFTMQVDIAMLAAPVTFAMLLLQLRALQHAKLRRTKVFLVI